MFRGSRITSYIAPLAFRQSCTSEKWQQEECMHAGISGRDLPVMALDVTIGSHDNGEGKRKSCNSVSGRHDSRISQIGEYITLSNPNIRGGQPKRLSVVQFRRRKSYSSSRNDGTAGENIAGSASATVSTGTAGARQVSSWSISVTKLMSAAYASGI